MKLTIAKLAKRLEDEIHERLARLRELEIECIDMEKKHRMPSDILKKHIEMSKIIIELQPVEYIIFSQFPHLEQMFDSLIEVHKEHVERKKKTGSFEDAMEMNSFDIH